MKHRRVASALVAAMASAPLHHAYAKPLKPLAPHFQASENARARVPEGVHNHPRRPRTPGSGQLMQPQGPSRGSVAAKAVAARKACQPHLADIRSAERRKGFPAGTLEALLYTESRCRPKAEHKRTRARGLGQFVPSGAAAVGRIQRDRGEPAPWFRYADAWDPAESIAAAAELLAFGLELCGGLAEALRLYNTGRCGKPSAFSRTVLRLAAALRFVFELEPTS